MSILKMREHSSQFYGIETFASWIKKDSIMAEIGSYAGESAKIFLDSGNVRLLFCVDPWMQGYDEMDAASQSNMSEVENVFDSNLSKYNNYVKVKKTSLEAASMFPDHFFDLVYIDGNHKYEAVLEDLKIWIPKIKPGGWVTGHDFYPPYSSPSHPVTKAVLDYFREMPWSLFNDSSWIYKI